MTGWPTYAVVLCRDGVRSYSFFPEGRRPSYRIRDGFLWHWSTLGPDGEPLYPGSIPEGAVVNETHDRTEHDQQMSFLAAACEVHGS